MALNPQIRSVSLDLLWQLPVAIVSWLSFHISKSIISSLYKRHISRDPLRRTSWQLLSQQTFERAMSLPVLMTRGPRWNTHATIGTLGPVSIRRQLSVDTHEARNSADTWTVAVYAFPSFRTVAHLQSLDPESSDQWSTIDLAAGDYILGIRYYDLAPSARMPAVLADSEPVASPLAVDHGTNAVYNDLARHTTLFYRLIHFYVHPMLRLRGILPDRFIESEYLPAGDPCTLFRYDWFPADCSLEIEASSALLASFEIYVTVYNRASLPIHSCRLMASPVRADASVTAGDAGSAAPLSAITTPVLSCAGFYLIRLRPHTESFEPSLADDLVIRRRVTASPANHVSA
ncbi:hypothetical protein EVJ50_02920 [Synechococcus sp. RSCCF101]|uniref:DUF6208 family protein n=1 Tax=Synechococcus sp. RSCCF101 TaxID=2511069 RepID=UPI001248E54A|nr:DUF6208 family protein [Synechococcus sp. RSCCF101]QEY31359.1 hypothetical protein EVJ50_02920 [Synechococcus sp. RSCCF101]